MIIRKVDITCKGRDMEGKEALEEGIPVVISIRPRKPPIVLNAEIVVEPVRCPYNTGGHGQRCKASHPGQDKVGNGVFCPFSFDYPYVLEGNPYWGPPEIIAEAFREAKAQ